MAAAGSAAGVERLEAILEYAVQACGDAHSSCATAETTQAYVRARTVAFAIVRTVRGGAGDAFLWRLCKKHRYFGGLCQLALDHEARSDRDQFALRPLFREELGMQQDIQTGKKFGTLMGMRIVLNARYFCFQCFVSHSFCLITFNCFQGISY